MTYIIYELIICMYNILHILYISITYICISNKHVGTKLLKTLFLTTQKSINELFTCKPNKHV